MLLSVSQAHKQHKHKHKHKHKYTSSHCELYRLTSGVTTLGSTPTMGGGSVLRCFFSSNDVREKMIHYIDNPSCNNVDVIIYMLIILMIIIYRVSQKNGLSECCWSHSALAQSQVAGTPCVWKLIFWSFLTKTKPDQAFPSHVHGKI